MMISGLRSASHRLVDGARTLGSFSTKVGASSAVPVGEREVDAALSGGHNDDRFDREVPSKEAGRKFEGVPYQLRPALKVKVEGKGILMDALYNKGAAFPLGERDRLGIRGLLPPRRVSMEDQIRLARFQLDQETSPIRKHNYLRELLDRNETLFHRLLIDNIEELAPIIYTPTVGEACIKFGESFRNPRGMYFNYHDRGDMAAMVHNWPSSDVRVIVVTDGSRILGLGDLGANGMSIPIGKLALYCAAGGIAPHRVLPVMFDAGTDNEELLNDSTYLGMQHKRLSGDAYYDLLDEFVHACFSRWPNVFMQFEDFSSDKALPILEKYKNDRLCFNDDVQGTGAVAVAGVMGALTLQGLDIAALGDQRFLIAGAGSAGLGVARKLAEAISLQGKYTFEEAVEKFWVCDVDGVLKSSDSDKLTLEQRLFARDDETAGMSLLDVAKTVKPTALMGLTACGGLFKRELVETMAKNCDRPIIFPLSNPTSSAECTAKDAYEWTNGRAIFASGSPFDPVTVGSKTFVPSQCNNMFVFPAIGLGATVAGARRVSKNMIYAASEALATSLTEEEMNAGQVFPSIPRIRNISLRLATAIVRAAKEEGLTSPRRIPDHVAECDERTADYIEKRMYDPVYVPLVDLVYSNRHS